MNAEKPNAAAGKDAQVVPPRRQRGWFRRNWLWFLPALILLVIVLGAGGAYWAFFVRIYRLDVVQAATQTIKSDKGLQEVLGRPIHKAWWPSREVTPQARIEDREKEVRWTIQGPKGTAKVILRAELRQGEWQTVVFDVTLPSGKKVSLQQADDNNVAPPAKFQPATSGDKTPAKTPPPDIDLPIPPADGPG